MKVGRLRYRLVISTYTESLNDYGELTPTWTTFATVYADITPVSGREYLQSERVQGEITHRITIRHLAGVLSKMRASDGSRTFEIEAIIPDRTNKKMITLMCKELKA
jgi:SPP1 family predicted phage head-tail adaptor